MKLFNGKLLGLIAAVLTMLAGMFVTSASCMTIYQPKAPKSLMKN